MLQLFMNQVLKGESSVGKPPRNNGGNFNEPEKEDLSNGIIERKKVSRSSN